MEGWRPGRALAEWEQTHGKKKAKCVLTSTGLLMEGLSKLSLSLTYLVAQLTMSAYGRYSIPDRSDLFPLPYY